MSAHSRSAQQRRGLIDAGTEQENHDGGIGQKDMCRIVLSLFHETVIRSVSVGEMRSVVRFVRGRTVDARP